MGCPGCNYNSGCGNYAAVSYTPTITSHGPSPVSFSHKEVYTGIVDITPGSVQYHSEAVGYIGNKAPYAGMPAEINYQISDLIEDAKTKNLPAVRNDAVDAVPMIETKMPEEVAQAIKNGELLSSDEKQLMEALYRQLMANDMPRGGVRLTQVEEETIIMQRKRVRVVDIFPEEKKMRDANEDY